RGSLFARLKIPLRIIVLASFRAKRRIPALFFPSPCKGEDRRRGSLFSARLISRATQDSAPHYCPCVIQSEAQNPGSFSPPRPIVSFRAKRRIPALSLPLALQGRGSKERVLVQRAIHFARGLEFCLVGLAH